MSLCRFRFFAALAIGAVVCAATPSSAAPLTVGVDVVAPGDTPVPELNALASQLQAAGVTIVRTGLPLNPKDIAFAKNLSARGIRLILDLGARFPPSTPIRPANPNFPGMRAGHPLIDASPQLSAAFFHDYLKTLDDNGIVLEAIELDNEINWADSNATFPLPGEGKILSLDDLYNDPEGRLIAQSYLQYLKVLSTLKEARDHSKLNRNTPLISAGLSTVNAEGPKKLSPNPSSREDAVSISATLRFMRQNGLDRLVDGYGIHFYPQFDPPAMMRSKLMSFGVSECKPAGISAGKPCWITEWGVPNRDKSCPSDESKRLPIVADTMQAFRQLARTGRVVNVIYYDWGTTGADKSDRFGVYRCGALTESGRQALQP